MDFYSNDKFLCYVPDNTLVGDEVHYNNITYIVTKRCIEAYNTLTPTSVMICKGKPKFENLYKLWKTITSLFKYDLFKYGSDEYWNGRFKTILSNPKSYPSGLLALKFDLLECDLNDKKSNMIASYIAIHYTVDDTH